MVALLWTQRRGKGFVRKLYTVIKSHPKSLIVTCTGSKLNRICSHIFWIRKKGETGSKASKVKALLIFRTEILSFCKEKKSDTVFYNALLSSSRSHRKSVEQHLWCMLHIMTKHYGLSYLLLLCIAEVSNFSSCSNPNYRFKRIS